MHQIQQKVLQGYRPEILREDCLPQGALGILNKCWAAAPSERPDFVTLVAAFQRLEKEFAAGSVPARGVARGTTPLGLLPEREELSAPY